MRTSPRKRIAFWGTPPFVVPFLDTLATAGFAPSLVVTGPDRPVGRGMHVHSPLPKAWADAQNIPVLQPEKIEDAFFATLSETPWDMFIVVAYGKILPERVIVLPTHGTINVHYSLLPKYRGATPVESAILSGEKTTGITIQQMVYKLDAGDILAAKEVAIDPADTTPSLREKLNTAALGLLPETIQKIFTSMSTPILQDESRVSTSHKLTKEMGEIDLADEGVINDRKFRAHQGSIGSYFFMDGTRIKISQAHLEETTFVIDEVIPENGKPLSWEAFQKRNKSDL